MKRKKISAKVWASIMAAAMVMSTCPTAAFAVTADKVAADGTYTATRHVYRTIEIGRAQTMSGMSMMWMARYL